MSSTGIARAKSTPVVSNHRLLRRVLIGAALLFCVLGALVSIVAAVRLITRPMPSSEIEAALVYPVWGIAHFLPGLMFMTLVPLQLWPAFRNRHRVFHRWSGRILVATGIILGISGVTFPFVLSGRLFSERVAMSTFFSYFLFCIIKAFAAARRRDFVRHREWMIRWFAVGLAIMVQRVLLTVFIVAVGMTDMRSFWEIFVSAAWLASVIQVLVAEWWIHTSRGTDPGVKPA